MPGRVNAAGRILTDFEVNPTHVADAIRRIRYLPMAR